MGGQQSKQKVSATTRVASETAMDLTQNCVSYMDGTQVISINGNNNVFSGNTQRMSMNVDAKCVSQAGQDGSFENKLNDAVTQQLKNESVALTQWLDNSKQSLKQDIDETVTSAFKFKDVQNCMNELTGTQVIAIEGDDNVVTNNLQDQSMALAADCLMAGAQTSQAASDITNTMNQHSTYTSKNPFAFITDAIEGVFQSAFGVAALVFIAIVILVIVFEVGVRHRKKRRERLSTSSAAPPPGPPDDRSGGP